MLPEDSVFWVNYNSIHVINIIKKSLDAIFQLDYPNFELMIVDNCSTDSSEEVIEEHVKSKAINGVKVKFLRLSRNLGFAGGVNVARAEMMGSGGTCCEATLLGVLTIGFHF